MKASKLAIVLFSLTLGTLAMAGEVSDQKAKELAEAGLSLHNESAKQQGHIQQRLVEFYSKIDASNCEEKGKKIICTFDTTEEDMSDDELYTPNTLTVTQDKKGKIKIGFEIGC